MNTDTHSPKSTPKVLFFDASGTLFHLPLGVGHHYASVANRHGVTLDPGAIDAAFRRAWKNAAPPPETKLPRPDDDRGWWKALADEVFIACGAPHLIDKCFDELWQEFALPGVWELYPETLEVLTTLSPRFRLGVISNFDTRLHAILTTLGIARFFEHITVSSEVGAEKPSPHIFECALKKFGVAPQEALHIGDEPGADWQGAPASGLQAFELRRPENSLRDLLAVL